MLAVAALPLRKFYMNFLDLLQTLLKKYLMRKIPRPKTWLVAQSSDD